MADLHELGKMKMWPLVIIDLNGGVEPGMVMQKYGFLITKLILRGDSGYAGWNSKNFDTYSWDLQDCLRDLQDEKYIKISNHCVQMIKKRKYTLTRAAKKILGNFKDGNQSKVTEIKKFLKYYKGSDDKLAADAYMRFPEYADESRVKERIHKNILKRCRPGDRELVLGYDCKKIDLAKIVKKSAEFQYGLCDIKFTDALAKKIGMSRDEYTVPVKGDFSDVLDGMKIIKNIDPEKFLDIVENTR